MARALPRYCGFWLVCVLNQVWPFYVCPRYLSQNLKIRPAYVAAGALLLTPLTPLTQLTQLLLTPLTQVTQLTLLLTQLLVQHHTLLVTLHCGGVPGLRLHLPLRAGSPLGGPLGGPLLLLLLRGVCPLFGFFWSFYSTASPAGAARRPPPWRRASAPAASRSAAPPRRATRCW